MPLQIKRGTDTQRIGITPVVGEPIFTTDTKKLYIGDGSTAGGNLVTGGDSFTTIAIAGQSNVVADSPTDTLTLVAGSNITLTTNAGTDTITIAASGGGVTDGDKGDITVSSSGATWTIDNTAVTYAKIQNVTASRLLGRGSSGNGSPEELTVSAGLTISSSQLGINESDDQIILALRVFT